MQRKQFLRYLGLSAGSVALAPLLAACGGGGDPLSPEVSATSAGATEGAATTVTATLSPEEIEALKFMREEEKLAHDVYATLYGVWGAEVFARIAESETEHTAAVLDLLLAHGVEDPVGDNPVGVFVDEALQQLHDTLVAAGQSSLIDALKVGALIEEKDIQDIQDKLDDTDEPDIIRVYEHLLCGSRNHLRAFHRALVDQGVDYEATVITQEEWDAIASGAWEQCGG